MNESGVERFDIPDIQEPARCIGNILKGFLLFVDRCKEHGHWIRIKSLGDAEYLSAGDTTIESESNISMRSAGSKTDTVGGDKRTTVHGSLEEYTAGDKTDTVDGDKHTIVLGRISLTAEIGVFIGPIDKATPDIKELDECFDGEMINLRKFIEWSSSRINLLEKKLASLQMQNS